MDLIENKTSMTSIKIIVGHINKMLKYIGTVVDILAQMFILSAVCLKMYELNKDCLR